MTSKKEQFYKQQIADLQVENAALKEQVAKLLKVNAELLRDDEVNQVVDVWKTAAVQEVNGNLAVKIKRFDVLTGLFDVPGICVQTVDKVTP